MATVATFSLGCGTVRGPAIYCENPSKDTFTDRAARPGLDQHACPTKGSLPSVISYRWVGSSSLSTATFENSLHLWEFFVFRTWCYTLGVSQRYSRPLLLLFFVVLANYLSQIPYYLHLYGLRVDPRGEALLGPTLAWFLIGFWFLFRRRPTGYWLIHAFLAVQFLFYFKNDTINMLYGYGLIYHLTKVDDPVIWAVELIGDVNFMVAAFFLHYLARNRRALLGEGVSGTVERVTRG